MNYLLFDDSARLNLKPISFTRPVSEIRAGILTIREKWDIFLNTKCSYLTADYLKIKYPSIIQQINILINGSLIPDNNLVEAITKLKTGEAIVSNEIILAACCTESELKGFDFTSRDKFKCHSYSEKYLIIRNLWDIFSLNGQNLEADYKLITKGRKSEIPSKTVSILGNNIFIEKGAKLECCILNSTSGPIYIGKDAEVMEGAAIRGPFALCDHSVVKLNAKIYGPTTIGPHSKVGGEINNSVIFGFSNKAHDGFLGNSVIGEWCNIGADSNNSNLKNNYAEVKLWSYSQNKFVKTGLQFCGLIMADHSKCAINTMFNTGTVVGVSANIFGNGFPRNFISDFSWGGAHGFSVYEPEKAFEVAEIVMSRRSVHLTEVDKQILRYIFDETESFRKF